MHQTPGLKQSEGEREGKGKEKVFRFVQLKNPIRFFPGERRHTRICSGICVQAEKHFRCNHENENKGGRKAVEKSQDFHFMWFCA
jgi:hypothetical protein